MGAGAAYRPFKFASGLDAAARASGEVPPTSSLPALQGKRIVQHPLALAFTGSLTFASHSRLASAMGASGARPCAYGTKGELWYASGDIGVDVDHLILARLA